MQPMHFLAFSVFKLLCGLSDSESANRNDPLHILLLNQLSLIFDKSIHRSFILPVFRNLNELKKSTYSIQHTMISIGETDHFGSAFFLGNT